MTLHCNFFPACAFVLVAAISTATAGVSASANRIDRAGPTQDTTADGDLDPSFGIGGRLLVVRDTDDTALDAPLGRLARLPDGAVQAVMRHHFDGPILLQRYDVHGVPDAAFGTGGEVQLDTCSGSGDVAIATTADNGALVWTGECLIKLTADGMPDTAFGQQGMVEVGAGRKLMTRDSGSRIVLVGLDDAGMYAYRYRADGSVDPAFGSDGIARLDFSFTPNPDGNPSVAQLYALVVGPQGAISAGGHYYAAAENTDGILMLRLRDDGSPDTAFADGGVLRYPTTTTPTGYAWVDAMLPLDDGGLVVAGPAHCWAASCVLLGRFDADGGVNAEFGLQRVTTPGDELNFDTFFEQRHALAPLPDGRILLGLTAWPPPFLISRTDLTLMRFLPDGSIDASFGDSGWRAYSTQDPCASCGGQDGESASYDMLHDMLLADGKVTLLGRSLFEDSSNRNDYLTLTRVLMDRMFANGFD